MTPHQAGLEAQQQAEPAAASLLAEAGLLFNSRLQIDEIVALLACRVAERLAVDCVFFMLGRSDEALSPRAWQGATPDRQARLDEQLKAMRWSLDDGKIAQALNGGTALLGPSADELPAALQPLTDALGASCTLAAPLVQGQELLGVLLVIRPGDQPPLDPEEMRLVAALAPQAAASLVNARTLAGERWQRQKAELMFQASKAVHTELHFDQAIREITLLLKQSIKVPWVGLFEYQAHDRQFSLLGSTSEPAIDLRLGSQRLTGSEWEAAEAAINEPDREGTLKLPPSVASAIGHPGSAAWAFPLVHKQVPQGLLLLLAGSEDEPCSSETAEVATGIAELVALAIANQHLIDQEAKARIQIIRSQAAMQEREVLLRQIVHDLRNATQAMSLVVEDIELAAGDTPELLAGLSTLNSQITFISNFLKEKLNWIQKGDAGHGGIATGLPDVFADLEGRFGPAARAKHQRLVVSAPEPIQVPLSAVQVEQILGNLLDNAIKYTPAHGEVRLWADVSDGWATIYVADNGPGIPAAAQARLGEVGYRGEHGEEGAGLGLANVRQLVTRAGGLFGVSSHANQGTTFHVSLPTTTWGRVIS